MEARSHKDLIVWGRAMALCEQIYRISEQFPQREIYGLSSQMRRAAVSIPSNIAEGRNRATRKDYAHFLHIAYGSSAELETQLLIAARLELFPRGAADETFALLTEVAKMLHVMIEKLGSESRS